MIASKRRHTVYLAVKCTVLVAFQLAILAPFYWLLITSFKPQSEIFSMPISYWPRDFSLENYISIFRMNHFGLYIFNSVYTSVVSSLVAVVFAVMGGYVIARFTFRLSAFVMGFFFLTQVLPAFVGLAPMYTMLSAWRMIDWLPTLIILNAAGMIPFSVITLRGFFSAVPRSIEDAALIDGCNRLQTLVRVVLPVVLPGIAAVFIFGFVQAWNNLFAPVLYMNKNTNYTIPVALNSMVLKNNIRWGDLSAGSVIAIVPTIIMFGFVQKYIATGLTSGAVKG